MKVYLIKQEDIDKLLALVDRGPAHGTSDGSSHVLTVWERRVYNEAHSFYNFQVRKWVDEITK